MLFLNGKALLDYVLNHEFCEECNLLILTDLNMPHMDGIELAQLIRAENLMINHSIILVSSEDCDNSESLFNDV